ncbi:uncharacterized protein LAJ45_08271 [Morchella importuna]|uniref:uncharacterized protein n=1 Tax=Morchella importuna TaxID=1174673 RepID=UPI001E8DF075|nr:uncharacterized protein LAJ45_08271 [Morchella importuna]KAH8147805.1 hypothetical protein LAJ45_08271 [Morchella importuna]
MNSHLYTAIFYHLKFMMRLITRLLTGMFWWRRERVAFECYQFSADYLDDVLEGSKLEVVYRAYEIVRTQHKRKL